MCVGGGVCVGGWNLSEAAEGEGGAGHALAGQVVHLRRYERKREREGEGGGEREGGKEGEGRREREGRREKEIRKEGARGEGGSVCVCVCLRACLYCVRGWVGVVGCGWV